MAGTKKKEDLVMQPVLPEVTDEINAEIIRLLKEGKGFEEARLSAGKAEKTAKDAAQTLIKKYYPSGQFIAGEGDEKVVAYFEVKRKIRIRTGENAELPEDIEEISGNDESVE